MKKTNFKEVAFLLRQSQYLEGVDLSTHIKKFSKTKGAVAATRILYFELLDKSLNKPDGSEDALWIIKPKSFALPDSVKDWIIDIELEGLFEYFSKSTFKDALQSLHKSGLIFIDQRNSIHIKYPVLGNMLSPKFAYIAILSEKKRAKEGCPEEDEEKNINEKNILDITEDIDYNSDSDNNSSEIGSSIDWESM